MNVHPLDPTLTKSEILAYVRSFDVSAYAKTRNRVSGTVSRLSPYITRGVVSLPEIRAEVLAGHTTPEATKFIQELAWREYWQQVWVARGEDIFTDLRFPRDDWCHTDLVRAIVSGKTGIVGVDEAVTGLYETGYMHNQPRLWTAMMACNVADAHWYNMSRWMYYHLYDGDLASNMLSWQWVAGTNAGKRYVAHQKLINACGNTAQVDTFLTMDRAAIGTGHVPDVLQETMPFSYTMSYPTSEEYDQSASDILLYSPWTLDPNWRRESAGERLLLLEPRWFDRFPVSPSVLRFIITVARTHIPGIKVVVANASDLRRQPHARLYSRHYPATVQWPGEQDPAPRLFPAVTGYYSSFFKYWRACEQS